MKIFKRKSFHIGGSIFAFLMIVGFIGSTPLCNWNLFESSVIPDGLCIYFGFIYFIYIGIGIIASPINGVLWGNNLGDVTHWTIKDWIIKDAKSSIAITIIGYIIGGLIGLLIGKIINKFKKTSP